jgi:hypothetical protein
MALPLKVIRLSLSTERKSVSPTKRRPQKRENEKLESATPPSNQNSQIPAKLSEFPPNENLKKLADEAYGDRGIRASNGTSNQCGVTYEIPVHSALLLSS